MDKRQINHADVQSSNTNCVAMARCRCQLAGQGWPILVVDCSRWEPHGDCRALTRSRCWQGLGGVTEHVLCLVLKDISEQFATNFLTIFNTFFGNAIGISEHSGTQDTIYTYNCIKFESYAYERCTNMYTRKMQHEVFGVFFWMTPVMIL